MERSAVCLCLALSVCLSVSVCLYLSVSLSLSLSVCLSVSLSPPLSVCLCLCLSVYLSVSVCLFLAVSVCLSVSLPTAFLFLFISFFPYRMLCIPLLRGKGRTITADLAVLFSPLFFDLCPGTQARETRLYICSLSNASPMDVSV